MQNLKPKYFLYARKSTEDDDHQIMSIEAQLFELREYARRENIEILREFTESKSAKKPGREVFNKMMEQIEASDVPLGILAWHPDRLARNSVDGGKVVYLVDTEQITALRFPTFWFEPTPQGKFMLQVAFGQSKYYSDNLVENINRGIRQKVRRGEWLVKAPFGYVNNPKTRNIEPHPTKSRIVVRAFEEYAKGTHTLGSIGVFLADHGVSTKGTPPAKSAVARLLSNRVYLGFVRHRGEYYDGSFAPIVSPTLFEAVQKILQKKGKPRVIKSPNSFPFAQFARCGECGSMITAQYCTNRFGTKYTYYRCTKKRGVCRQPHTSASALTAQIKSLLQTVSRKNWVEPLRKFVLSLREAVELEKSENYFAWRTYFQSIGSNPMLKDKALSIHWGELYEFMAHTKANSIFGSVPRATPTARPDTVSADVSMGGR